MQYNMSTFQVQVFRYVCSRCNAHGRIPIVLNTFEHITTPILAFTT